MSTAHRPNFTAAKARAPNAQRSVQTSVGQVAQHSKLKFRTPAAASGSGGRDLKRELEEAEWEASNRKRLRDGLEPLPAKEGGREEMMKKALEMDRDSEASDEDDDDEEEEDKDAASTDDNKSISTSNSSSDDSDTDNDSDEQTLLLRELEKIKQERAAEKHRQATLAFHQTNLSREDEIARGNPLLNLQHALSSTPTANELNFEVNKRWDHDVIFKNQSSAAGNTGKERKSGFVNDLTRSEFHKKFMNRYIK